MVTFWANAGSCIGLEEIGGASTHVELWHQSGPATDPNYPLGFLENINCKDYFSPMLVAYRSTRSLGGKDQNAPYL